MWRVGSLRAAVGGPKQACLGMLLNPIACFVRVCGHLPLVCTCIHKDWRVVWCIYMTVECMTCYCPLSVLEGEDSWAGW